jgi:hypothetical protein
MINAKHNGDVARGCLVAPPAEKSPSSFRQERQGPAPVQPQYVETDNFHSAGAEHKSGGGVCGEDCKRYEKNHEEQIAFMSR